MDLMEDWVHNANECIHLDLLRRSSISGEDEAILAEPFHPSFTYPIFENEETIIGYKDPRIRLGFRANDLRPWLHVQYEHKMDLSSLLGDEAQGRQTDIDTVFKAFLPAYVFDASQPPDPAVPDPHSNTWRPPGELRNSFETRGRKYEIWSCSMSDPRALQIWRNMEILVLLYIEGASQLELDEEWSLERWTLHLVYEVTPIEDSWASPYTIAGFSTSHRYWVFPTLDVLRATKSLPSPPSSTNGDATSYTLPRLEMADPSSTDAQDQSSPPRIFRDALDPLSVPSRERISQFLILPPYQSQSLGSKLYTTIFNHYVALPNIYEIPVEDPSEAFDAMRDYADILYLRSIPEFASLSIASSLSAESLRKDAPIPRDTILGGHAGVDMDALRRQTKIVARQFNRMVELHLLSTIPPLHRSTARISRKAKSSNPADRQYYFWRLAMKARIYAQNRDVLDQLEDASEKVEKLEDAVNSQEQEYLERLEGIERRRMWAEGEMSSMGSKNEDGTAGHDGRWERSTNTKRKRVVVEEDGEDDEDDDWEDVDEEGGGKRPKV